MKVFLMMQMKQTILSILGGILITHNLSAQTMNQTETPLFGFSDAQPFAVNIQYEIGTRDFVYDDIYADSMDKSRIAAGISVDVLPFVGIFGEAGAVQAKLDNDNEEGSYGFTWAAGVDLNLFEFIISKSPVIGKKKWLQLRLLGRVEYDESNFDGMDFSWYDYKVIPSIIYNQNFKTKAAVSVTQPMAVEGRIGLIFSSIDGDGENVEIVNGDLVNTGNKADFSEDNNIGVLLEAAFLAQNDWSGRVTTEIYGSGQGSMIFSMGYNF